MVNVALSLSSTETIKHVSNKQLKAETIWILPHSTRARLFFHFFLLTRAPPSHQGICCSIFPGSELISPPLMLPTHGGGQILHS